MDEKDVVLALYYKGKLAVSIKIEDKVLSQLSRREVQRYVLKEIEELLKKVI
jgi:hypothetical protein